MQTWQQTMREANGAAQLLDDKEAYGLYQLAIADIEQRWPDEPESMALLMGWIAGLHNLSALLEKQGDAETALRYLTLPHHWVLALINDETISESFRLAAHRVINITLTALLEFSQRQPVCESCEQLLQATQQWLQIPKHQLH
ncbi:MAG: DUF2753 family protein [Psychrobium sp.]|nr:DUF2753 family protein [Psychrobium sp.]